LTVIVDPEGMARVVGPAVVAGALAASGDGMVLASPRPGI
jgi:hypothetical protein